MQPSSEDALDDLVMRHMPLVRTVAWRVYQLRGFDGVPIEDYIQYGVEGLIQALRRYDIEQGARFETYATHRIRGAILTGLEQSSEVNQQIATMRRLNAERLASLAERPEKHDPSDPEQAFARLLNVSVGMAIAFMLEDTGLYVEEDSLHWADGQANASFLQLQERLGAAVNTLSESERSVIDGHYFQHRTFDEIARSLQLTKGRISQIHRQALGKLRVAIKVNRMDDLLG